MMGHWVRSLGEVMSMTDVVVPKALSLVSICLPDTSSQVRSYSWSPVVLHYAMLRSRLAVLSGIGVPRAEAGVSN